MLENEITLQDLIRAAKQRWGDQHLVASESSDGILTKVFIHAEKDNDLELLCEARTRVELLELIQGEGPIEAANGE